MPPGKPEISLEPVLKTDGGRGTVRGRDGRKGGREGEGERRKEITMYLSSGNRMECQSSITSFLNCRHRKDDTSLPVLEVGGLR